MVAPRASHQIEELKERLCSFVAPRRREALLRLKELADAGDVAVVAPRDEVNLHCHTFYSYNGYGYSPSRFAWEAYAYGLEVAGIVDFDCLDGVQEFLEAGRVLGVKTVAGMETRVFIEECRDREVNSPGEPGVYYLSAFGFTGPPADGTKAAAVLADMRRRAQERNLRVMRRVNAHLAPVRIDYEKDVLPLTPAGNATERHMLEAFRKKAADEHPSPDRLAGFWAEKLGMDQSLVRELLEKPPALEDVIRTRLMKRGGVGYIEPAAGSFPRLEHVVEMTLACGAVPSGCWLDGTSEGEKDPKRHFTFLRSKGIPTLTFIPDRNWNIDRPRERALKIGNLRDAVAAARELSLPVIVGTEMNKHGQKFVDAFESDALSPHRDSFLAGAHIAWGHTLLRMTAGVGYMGQWAQSHFGDDGEAKNEFFRRIGRADYPHEDKLRRLAAAGPKSPPAALADIMNA